MPPPTTTNGDPAKTNANESEAVTLHNAARSQEPAFSAGYRISEHTLAFDGSLIPIDEYSDIRRATLSAPFRSLPAGAVVSIKQIRLLGEYNERAHHAAKFLRQLHLWIRLDDPHVHPVVGFHLEDDLSMISLVSRFEPNGDLKQYIERTNPNQAERFRLAIETAKGLAYLHGRNPAVYHGDIKAANFIIGLSGQVMLSDFGLATVVSQDPAASGNLKGSIHWSAPEIMGGEPKTSAADIWAWACLSFEIFTGKTPYWEFPSSFLVVREGIAGRLPASSEDLREVPEVVQALIAECWQRDPKMRPDIQHCLSVLTMAMTEQPAVGPGRQRQSWGAKALKWMGRGV